MTKDLSNATVLLKDLSQLHEADKKKVERLNACLLAIEGPITGNLFDLATGISTFGRNPDNTYTIDADGISRKHFQIEVFDEDAMTIIRDLGSSNGTLVNGAKIQSPKTLQKNDRINSGIVSFRYIPKGDLDRLAYDKIHQAAVTDRLTGCFNKAYFLDILDQEFKKFRPHVISGHPGNLSLLVIDLDHFKKLNDTYGHLAGDLVLKEMAVNVRKVCVREGDIFVRYGGEEFVVILPNTPAKVALEIAERVRKTIESHPFLYEGNPLKVTGSVGGATLSQQMPNPLDLFKLADQAVYQSKAKGRNQVTFLP
ncbi:MAG: GGDEF domain-containing protein [Bacteriovoracaceae bacterium]|nr:GGDEF domain-containing protein [Bacteriovoracaceae bacterium]